MTNPAADTAPARTSRMSDPRDRCERERASTTPSTHTATTNSAIANLRCVEGSSATESNAPIEVIRPIDSASMTAAMVHQPLARPRWSARTATPAIAANAATPASVIEANQTGRLRVPPGLNFGIRPKRESWPVRMENVWVASPPSASIVMTATIASRKNATGTSATGVLDGVSTLVRRRARSLGATRAGHYHAGGRADLRRRAFGLIARLSPLLSRLPIPESSPDLSSA